MNSFEGARTTRSSQSLDPFGDKADGTGVLFKKIFLIGEHINQN